MSLNMSIYTMVGYKLTISSKTRITTMFLWGLCCSSNIFFVLSYYVSLSFEFRVVMCVTILACKRFSVRLYLQLFVGVLLTIFYIICVCLRIVVSNTYCAMTLFCLSLSCFLCTLCC